MANNGEVKELNVGTDMSSEDGRRFKKDPAVNVISKEEFEERIQKVFHLLWKTLSKSFGPYGAPTLIYNYPWSHVTKDGYTIMKNLSMDASETLVDQAIADMAADICGRLNYSVGDGTTSAVIATNSIYQNYIERRDWLNNHSILPRDIIKKYNKIKEDLVKDLQEYVRVIRSDDPETLYKNIYDVVYISSNGDEEITEYISDLYKELGCPAISCMLAPDGITKKRLIDGYKFDLTLTDKLYINSDDDTMKLSDADIVIFSTKVTKDTYEKILKPLNEQSKYMGRHLIVAAPLYDEVALRQVIARDLNNEYQKNKDINMVLTTYKSTSAHARRLIEDFAVLTNTLIIDRPIERTIFEEYDNGRYIWEIFNIHNREIQGTKCMILHDNAGSLTASNFTYGQEELPEGYRLPDLIENPIRLGYVKDCSIGLKSSVFGSFVYDEKRFDVIYKDAKDTLAETEAKYQKLGTFNLEVSQAQERFYSLNLKMGIIEVGADSELSQKLLKDAVDDAIKAAASAFNHGVVNGCNVDLLRAIDKRVCCDYDDVTRTLYEILQGGFEDVYRTVLSNAFNDIEIELVDGTIPEDLFNKLPLFKQIFKDYESFNNAIEKIHSTDKTVTTSLHDIIINYSVANGCVFDVSTKSFTNNVINSAQTDEEILKATIDLISLLITGNQMVVTQKHNF
jgi:chaperonin GroEL (HSP60 family)